MLRNIAYKTKDECCGCAACKNICPVKAISMQPDVLGFPYPVVNDEVCVHCVLCDKVCVFRPVGPRMNKPLGYALRHKNMDELVKSQSGGAFAVLSDFILALGGVVYGVVFDENFQVIHARAVNQQERDKMRGSKYVQSITTECFLQVKEDLKRGLFVLFSGTPCQVANLNSYVGHDLSERLYTLDIICHGVPGPAVWKGYIDWLQKRYGRLFQAFFRDKKYGWHSCIETFQFADKKVRRHTFRSLFYALVMLRLNCYKCPYANLNRPADITIGDFWGWEKLSDEFSDEKGVSLCLVNTEKGKQMLDAVKDRVELRLCDLEHCLQPNLQYPTKKNPLREQFEVDFAVYGFEYVARHYGDLNFKSKIKGLIRPVYKFGMSLFGK